MSAVFVENEEQRRVAEKTRLAVEEARGTAVKTPVLDLERFWLAEDYHQKYTLRRRPELVAEFEALYPELRAFCDSTAVTRVNAWLAGHGSADDLEREFGRLGLSEAGQRVVGKEGRAALR